MSRRVVVPRENFHRSFVASREFAPELARVPWRWRKRVINLALARMAWSSHYKIYESLARTAVREFVEQYIPAKANLAAGDDEICALAETAAQGVLSALADVGARGRVVRGRLGAVLADAEQLQIVRRECARYGVGAPDKKCVDKSDDVPAIVARAVCSRWWRRQLRKTYGRAREGGAIRLGMVHYRGEPYASNDSVLERIAQNRRNAAALESVLMENENGDQFTLAQLAEKSTANKAIRRGELMLRINGFESIARECGDTGLFLTWTCPSRFHARLKGGGGGGAPNPKYSGASPREANDYLGKVTAQARAALARRGLALYGFRIAEPHHDGCPHWHMLLFVRTTEKYKTHWLSDPAARVIRIMKRYAWRADRGEAGAFKYRLDAKRIDWNRGSAAGYIAKYVAKNIDGAHVGDHKTLDGYTVQTDLEGEQYLTPSARVETWAARWGIRQFQQWGGAPVTVWRELRRIKETMVKGAPAALAQAWHAAQKIEGIQRADFAQYLRAQGGAIVPRKCLVLTLAKNQTTVIGRYGETVRDVPYGVRSAELAGVVFHSTRYQWRQVDAARGREATGAGVAVAVAGAFAVPRTRVNNCTRPRQWEPASRPAGVASKQSTRPKRPAWALAAQAARDVGGAWRVAGMT
jgi:hypothetical protein